MQSAMDDRRNLLVDLHRLPNGAVVVAAGDFSFHSLGCVGLERIRCESY
jgi:hypothetical protein